MSETRKCNITVEITRNPKPMDFDAWATAYVRALIALDREQQAALGKAA